MNLKSQFGSSFEHVAIIAFARYSSGHFWFWPFPLLIPFVIVSVSSSAEFDLIAGLACLGFFLLVGLFSGIA